MTWKRYLAVVSIFVLLIGVGLVVAWMMPPRPGVTKTNFDRVQAGMSYEEVELIFGNPSALGMGSPTGSLEIWCNDDGEVAHISFERTSDQGLEVNGTYWIAPPETTWHKMLRWLRLK